MRHCIMRISYHADIVSRGHDTHVRMCVHTCTGVCSCLCACVFARVRACVCARARARACVRTCVCVCVCQVLVDEDDPGLGRVQIRVGFHSGPVVATVVGKKNPRFCLCASPPPTRINNIIIMCGTGSFVMFWCGDERRREYIYNNYIYYYIYIYIYI